MHETHPAPLTFHIPKPGPPPALKVLRPALPPEIGPDLQTDAMYLLDTGVGLGFAAIENGFDLLEKHFGSRLCYVDPVELEWRAIAREPDQPAPNSSAEEIQRWQQRKALAPHGRRALLEADTRFGPALSMTHAQLEDARRLAVELRAMPPPSTTDHGDVGECATILYGKVVEATEKVIVVSNDDRARRLADREGLAHRNMHTVLTEMVRAGHVSSTKAHQLCTHMRAVSELPKFARPEGPDDFT